MFRKGLNQLSRSFGVDQAFMKNLNSFSKRVKTRKSAVELEKLQKFLNFEKKEGSLYQKINTTADMDTEFENFVQSYRKEYNRHPNIIDLSRFFDEENNLQKDVKLRYLLYSLITTLLLLLVVDYHYQ